MVNFIHNKLRERKFAKQRVKNKYSEDMCWSLYNTMLEILPKMIDDLRKMKHRISLWFPVRRSRQF